jgi:hypothetical protein
MSLISWSREETGFGNRADRKLSLQPVKRALGKATRSEAGNHPHHCSSAGMSHDLFRLVQLFEARRSILPEAGLLIPCAWGKAMVMNRRRWQFQDPWWEQRSGGCWKLEAIKQDNLSAKAYCISPPSYKSGPSLSTATATGNRLMAIREKMRQFTRKGTVLNVAFLIVVTGRPLIVSETTTEPCPIAAGG